MLTDYRLMGPPLLLTALLLTWSAVASRSWLFTLVLAVVGVADLPFIERVRVRRGTAVALLVHVGVLVVGWFVAFLVWVPFVDWE